jgi:hypothetical protein
MILDLAIIDDFTPQFGAYLTIVIYDHKIFIVQATGYYKNS